MRPVGRVRRRRRERSGARTPDEFRATDLLQRRACNPGPRLPERWLLPGISDTLSRPGAARRMRWWCWW